MNNNIIDNLFIFLKKYKTDVFFILALLIVYIITAFILGPIYGDLLIDCGREAYLPEMLLKGKVLTKDIFWMYNPLSYQFNALLYFIFGKSLNVLFAAAYVNAFLILLSLYFISRLFIKQSYSFVFCIFLMSEYILGINESQLLNYIYPYSFAMVYATCLCQFSVLLFLLYMKKDNIKLLYGSFLLLGLSLANKPEFIFCIIPMLIFALLKKNSLLKIINCLIFLAIPTILSYGIMFLQGFSWQDLLNYIEFVKNFFATDEQKFYNSRFIIKTLTLSNIRIMFWDLFNLLRNLLVGAFILICFNFSKKLYIKLICIIALCLFCYNYYSFWSFTFNNTFSWVSIAILIIIPFLYKCRKDISGEMLVFLALCAIFSMGRINFLPVAKTSYAIYFLLGPLFLYIFFVSSKSLYINKFNLQKHVSIILLLMSFINISITKDLSNRHFVKFSSPKGSFYTNQYIVDIYNELIDWTYKNTKETDSVLFIPEGVMLNYITGRETKLMYYHLIPNHISALGEDNVVQGLNSDKPEYIIINSYDYSAYGKGIMCQDFGFKICQFVKDNYIEEKSIDNRSIFQKMLPIGFVTVKIYKLKPNISKSN